MMKFQDGDTNMSNRLPQIFNLAKSSKIHLINKNLTKITNLYVLMINKIQKW